MSGRDPLAAYHDWIVREALPLWASDGFDAAAGRFEERLDPAGKPLDAPHRAIVQARQIFVFAEGARRGWFAAGGRLAETAMAAMLRDYLDEDDAHASFAFSVGRDGRVVSAVRDAYTQAFALFALAGLHRLNGDPRLLAVADRVIRFLDEVMTDRAHGGLFDALPQADGTKRQNPHMHLFEAYLFLERTAPGRGYLARAGRIVEMFKARFFHRAGGCLLEYFAADWSPHPDPARAVIWEPGHHFEWVWLLHEYGAMAGEAVEPWTAALHDAAIRHGLAANGRIVDEIASDDRRVLRPSSRVWPHTEAIKAGAARHQAGDPSGRRFAGTMAQALLDGFLDRPFAGGWIDHRGADGAVLVDYVPASSLYHLFLADVVSSDTFAPAPVAAQPA